MFYNSGPKESPQVTGISPKDGAPGTKVTIRGEHLGVDSLDLIGLRICGVDCLLSAEWKSSNKIVARTGQARGKGDIIVLTRSGGVGTCTINFRGYIVQIGPNQESAVWIDETQTLNMYVGRNRATSPMISTEHDEPLGISDESNETSFPEEELTEMFPDGSGNTAMENFVSAWFLLENHHGTSFDDLKAGLAFLKRKSTQRNEGPVAFVKSNLSTFMDCQDTLAAMHEKLVSDQLGSKTGSITDPLEVYLNKSNNAADALFQDVLGRKDRADATRNALGVLHRFKFLFYLPCTIDKNVKRGDYDLVITDYTRAKSLFGETEVHIFRKVYQEVENRIAAFRDMLNKKLLQLPSSLDEQKRLIRYLVYLETPGEPAWDCLVNMQKWLLGLLDQCKNQHLAKEKEVDKPEKSEATTPLSPQLSIPQVSREPSFKGSKAPQKVQFVEHLTRILQDHLPDLWRLGQAYFSGKLLKEAKDKSTKIDTTKHAQFKQMILDIINLFSNLIRGAFLPHSLENINQQQRENFGIWMQNKKDSPIAWLPICVRHVRSCVISLANLDLASDSIELVQELAFDMRTNSMTTLLRQAVEDIKGLHHRETWIVDSHDERGGTTLLPALFEKRVSETAQNLYEVLQAKQGENEIFSQIPIQKEIVYLITEILRSFAGTLEQLAIVGNVERPVTNSTQATPDQSPSRRSAIAPDLFAHSEGNTMPSLDKRLMVVLSNCNQTTEHILPRLAETLDKYGYPETDQVLQEAMGSYQALDDRLFDMYIEEKANPIVGALEQNMYAGRFDWNDCPSAMGVRRYVKEALMGIIEVHAEVYAICPHFVYRVISKVIEAVVDEMSRLIQCVTGFNASGALQARLEIYAMAVAITPYSNNNMESSFKEATDCLPKVSSPVDKEFLEKSLTKYRTHMKLQLMCFQLDPKTRPPAN